MLRISLFAAGWCWVLLSHAAMAHDTWIQTNVGIVRAGDAVHLDLMLGNHGNDHRDFKLASKLDASSASLAIIAPSGKTYDLKDRLVDVGYQPKEGYWAAKFTAAEPGIHLATHTSTSTHGTTRSVKSAKVCFLVVEKLDAVPKETQGFDKAFGHPLELVPVVNPVAPLGAGLPIKVQVLYQGKPLAGARVSFIPRGVELAESFDEQYERKTAADGTASFTLTEGNWVLVAVHHLEPEHKGAGYDATKYSATLTVFVPEVCPCCE